jgi:prepilin-type N-terminal cleavage/methylation domain-containing protein
VRIADRGGFTIVEVLVAVAVLSVGVLALVGSAALTTRMVGWGQQSTRAAQAAAARVERLHQVASSTTPPCGAAEWRSDSAGAPGLHESWTLLDGGGPVRRVMIVLRTTRPEGPIRDTVLAAVLCGVS